MTPTNNTDDKQRDAFEKVQVPTTLDGGYYITGVNYSRNVEMNDWKSVRDDKTVPLKKLLFKPSEPKDKPELSDAFGKACLAFKEQYSWFQWPKNNPDFNIASHFWQAALSSQPTMTEINAIIEDERKKFKQEHWDTYGCDSAIAGEVSHDAADMCRALLTRLPQLTKEN